jgi:hypothetical protein
MEFKKNGKVFKIDFNDKDNIILINGKVFKVEYKSGFFLKFERKRIFSYDFRLLKAQIIESINTGFLDSYFFKVFEKMLKF